MSGDGSRIRQVMGVGHVRGWENTSGDGRRACQGTGVGDVR
jgi:hypothetical protein